MENIKKHFEQAEKKLYLEYQEKKDKILDDFRKTKNEITELVVNAHFSPFAVLDFENHSFDGVSETQNLPELLRIGKFNPCNLQKESEIPILDVPMLLPFSESGVSFILNDNDKRDVHTLFELIAFRLMLALPLNLSKFYFVDNNFGRDFALMNKIDKKIIGNSIITNQQEMNKLISDLEQIVVDAYKKHLATFDSLKDYNKTAGEMKEPYHFVFITNFPSGFTAETAEKLYNLINNGNAAKAGIYLFFSIDKNYKPPFGIDIRRFSDSTTCIYQNSEIDYEIERSIFSREFNNKFNIILDKSLPSNIEQIIDLINKKKVTNSIVSFAPQYEAILNENNFWKGSTIDNVKIPIGYVNPKQIQYLDFGKKTNDYFGLIGGLPRMGKTVLLHNIILWGAMEYSPFELSYYLIDCKNGTGFNAYQNLPHTKILSVSNDREFGASSMTTLIEEMYNRANLFKEASAKYSKQIENIHTYRKETGKQMSRILVIIDEFQVLFEKEDKIARIIRDGLNKIFREGSAFGISVLLCSQGISGVDVPIKNITWRLSFRLLSDIESQRILGNDQALQLTKIGNALINNQNGNKAHNINFQVGFVEDIYPFIEVLNKTYAERYPDAKIDRFISDGNINGRIDKNNFLTNNITNDTFKINDRYCDVYIGEPAFIRNEHAFVRIRKQTGSNIILVGSDIKSAISIIGLINYQLIKQSSEQSKFYIIDCFNIDNEYSECFNFAKKYFPNQLSIFKSKSIASIVDEVEKELQNRIDKEKEGEQVDGRIMVSIAYMQNCRELKKDGYNVSPVTKKLVKIIKEGAEYGIHVMLYSLTYQGVTDILETSVLNEFENRIALDSGKSMGIISEQTSTNISEKGTALLQAPDEFTTYNPDLIRVYSQFNVTEDKNSADIDFINKLLSI